MPPFLRVGQAEVRQLPARQPKVHEMVGLEVVLYTRREGEETELGVEMVDQDAGVEMDVAVLRVDDELPYGGAGSQEREKSVRENGGGMGGILGRIVAGAASGHSKGDDFELGELLGGRMEEERAAAANGNFEAVETDTVDRPFDEGLAADIHIPQTENFRHQWRRLAKLEILADSVQALHLCRTTPGQRDTIDANILQRRNNRLPQRPRLTHNLDARIRRVQCVAAHP